VLAIICALCLGFAVELRGIGLTNKVHPYCRFAIITMQMMQTNSFPQRVATDASMVEAIPPLNPIDVSVPLLLFRRNARQHAD
jgi:hypothetical protein